MQIRLGKVYVLALATMILFAASAFIWQQTSFACGCSQGGSTSCGGPGSCWKSSPESSCPGGKWWCQCSCEDLGGGYVCHSCGGSNPPNPCQESNPGSVTLQEPANNSLLAANSTLLKYRNNGGWGEGCPTKKSNRIQIKQANTNGTCSGGAWQNTAAQQTDLAWNTTYCWRVVRSNGGRNTTSPVWKFSTPEPPEVTESGFVLSTINKCDIGDAVSGRLTGTTNDAAINNPVTFAIDFSYAGGADKLRHVDLAFVADNTYKANRTPNNSINERYLEEIQELSHDQAVLATFMLRASNLNLTPAFSSVDSNTSPYYGAAATSGSLTVGSGIAKLREIGSASKVIQTGANSYRAEFTIEFNPTYAYQPLSVYIAVIAESADGTLVSHHPQKSRAGYDGNLVMQRVESWLVDMQAPSISISDANFIGEERFQLTWTILDTGEVEDVRSYCYFDEDETASILDETVNGNIELNGTPKGFPDPDYCLVKTAGVNARTYRVTAGALGSDIRLSAYAKDNACNITNANSLVDIPVPWLMTLFNATSVQGYNGVEIPNTSLALDDIGLTLDQKDYFSTYIAISGNNTLVSPINKQSQQGTYATEYTNNAENPRNFGYDNWYDLIEALVTEDMNVVNSSLTNVSGNLSTVYGLPVGTLGVVRHTGDLTFNSNTTCDMRAIILVEGNVVINPDFRKTTGNACVIVTQGNIRVERGTYKSIGIVAGAQAKYDVIQAMLVANGRLNILADPAVGSGVVGDGLYIRGLVYASEVDFNRRLNPNQSANQPSELIDYDPAYLFIFRELLSVAEFSLREF